MEKRRSYPGVGWPKAGCRYSGYSFRLVRLTTARWKHDQGLANSKLKSAITRKNKRIPFPCDCLACFSSVYICETNMFLFLVLALLVSPVSTSVQQTQTTLVLLSLHQFTRACVQFSSACLISRVWTILFYACFCACEHTFFMLVLLIVLILVWTSLKVTRTSTDIQQYYTVCIDISVCINTQWSFEVKHPLWKRLHVYYLWLFPPFVIPRPSSET